MSNNVYSEINLHFVWHVKHNQPLISEPIEPRLHRYIRNYALKTEELIFHEIGGIEDHVQIAVTIPPTLKISEGLGS
jgi:REP element-mobilizing transposase RayT